MIALMVIVTFLLILAMATQPIKSDISTFELKRLSKKQSGAKEAELARQEQSEKILIIKQLKIMLLVIILTVTSVCLWGWVWGGFASVLLVLISSFIASVRLTGVIASKLYRFYERYLLIFCSKYGRFLKKFNFINSAPLTGELNQISSKEELYYLLKKSSTKLADPTYKLVTNSLNFNERKVNQVMATRSTIKTVSKNEVLGPITLSRLHKTGHKCFPVIGKDIDHVVGVLVIKDLLKIDLTRDAIKASQAMEAPCFIGQGQLLKDALVAFLKTSKSLLIVVDKNKKTVGILSLEDVIEDLFGRKLVDEFTQHDSLPVVSKRASDK